MSDDDTDRPRGILTKADRKYLLGKKEFKNKQSAINARRRIRDRVSNALFDFYYLAEHLTDRDRKQLFDEADGLPRIQISLECALGFFYLISTEADQLSLQHLLTNGINRMEMNRGFQADVDLTIDRSRYETDSALEQFGDDESLPDPVVIRLLRENEIDRDDLLDYLKQQTSNTD